MHDDYIWAYNLAISLSSENNQTNRLYEPNLEIYFDIYSAHAQAHNEHGRSQSYRVQSEV